MYKLINLENEKKIILWLIFLGKWFSKLRIYYYFDFSIQEVLFNTFSPLNSMKNDTFSMKNNAYQIRNAKKMIKFYKKKYYQSNTKRLKITSFSKQKIIPIKQFKLLIFRNSFSLQFNSLEFIFFFHPCNQTPPKFKQNIMIKFGFDLRNSKTMIKFGFDLRNSKTFSIQIEGCVW